MCRPAHRCWRTRGRWRKRSKPPRRAATTTSALQSGSVTGAALITICKLWQILFFATILFPPPQLGRGSPTTER